MIEQLVYQELVFSITPELNNDVYLIFMLKVFVGSM